MFHRKMNSVMPKPYQNSFDCITAGSRLRPVPSSIRISGICASGKVSLSCSTHCFQSMTMAEAPTTKIARKRR